ncbi:hypothetical protein ACQPZZ_15755 [Microbispora sp. CA-135349]|uniref:hypothetical protein n=1 Tax=Microbispora sp. CA-135349 TaxID=3239953 RepID=UPI003D8A663B
MTHADPVGSVGGSSSAVGSVGRSFSAVGFVCVLERERDDGAADPVTGIEEVTVTVTVGVGDADVIPDPGSPSGRSATRATINPAMPARALTISQWTRLSQEVRARWGGREGPFDPGAEEPIEVTSDLLSRETPDVNRRTSPWLPTSPHRD